MVMICPEGGVGNTISVLGGSSKMLLKGGCIFVNSPLLKHQTFMVGDPVWFHKPGMVVVPNIKGIVREVLPCGYYRVSYINQMAVKEQ